VVAHIEVFPVRGFKATCEYGGYAVGVFSAQAGVEGNPEI
jgi:hypothetical protein